MGTSLHLQMVRVEMVEVVEMVATEAKVMEAMGSIHSSNCNSNYHHRDHKCSCLPSYNHRNSHRGWSSASFQKHCCSDLRQP